MSTNPDTVSSSESPKIRVSDGLLLSKTETLTDEPNTVTDISIQGSIDKTRVSGDQIEVVVMEKSLGENVVAETDLLESKAETLGDNDVRDSVGEVTVSLKEGVEKFLDVNEISGDQKEGDRVAVGDGFSPVRDAVSEVRVSGDEVGIVMEDVEKGLDVNGEGKEGDKAVVRSDLLDSKIETLNVDLSSEHDAVCADEPAAVLDEKVVNNDVKEGGEAVVGDDLLDLETETLTMELASDLDKGGDTVVRDSVGDASISADEKEVAMAVEKGLDVNGEGKEGDKAVVGSDLLDSKTDTLTVDLSSEHDAVSGDEPDTVLENAENVFDKVVNNGVKEGLEAVVGDDFLNSETETLTMVPASDLDKSGDTVVQDSVGDASVSADEREIAMDESGNVLDEKVVNNEGNKGDKTVNGADLSKLKTKTRLTEASTDNKGGGEVVMENDEKVLNENVVEEEEKDGEYKVTDMIWAKVKNYPWWPGQIFDPSASTDKAKKYSNKKAFFVAYFGDQSFAYNKASNIKPFRKNFSKMEKQSNSKGFLHAVNCALDEASRRVDFGLTCSCLSKDVRDKIKTQFFVNAGIKSEASRIDGGDRFSTVANFKPENIVTSVQDLAREHFDGYSSLEVMSVRTQLLAYYRWKGYKIADCYQHLPWEEDKVVEDAKPASVAEKVSSKEWKLKACDSLPSKEENMTRKRSSRDKVAENTKTDSVIERVSSKKRKLEAVEDDSESALVEEDKLVEDAKLASVGEKVYSKRKKSKASDLVTSKEKQNMTEMTHKESLTLSNGKDKVKKIGAGKTTVEDDSELLSVEEDRVVEGAEPGSVGEKIYSKKRKSKASDSVPSKKQKSLPKVTAKGGSSVSNGKSKRKENGGKIGVKKESGNGTGDTKSSISSPVKSFRIGASIMRIAKQLSESPLILKKESQESKHGMKKNSQKTEKDDTSDEETENSPTLQKVRKTDRKRKKKDRKLAEAVQLEE